MENNWVKVYSSSQLHEISIVKALLEEYEIETIEVNKQDSAYKTTIFGEVELYVIHDNVIKAKYLIEKNSL